MSKENTIIIKKPNFALDEYGNKWFSEVEINEAIRIVKYRQTTMDKKLNLLEEFRIELLGDKQ